MNDRPIGQMYIYMYFTIKNIDVTVDLCHFFVSTESQI